MVRLVLLPTVTIRPALRAAVATWTAPRLEAMKWMPLHRDART
jgi:hypothetical protein